MVHHFFILPPDSFWHTITVIVLQSGWIGVDLFFVLSGFLITRILFRELGYPHYFRNFYVRRVLRIFPLYFCFLLAWFLLTIVFGFVPVGGLTADQLSPEMGYHWFFATNILIARVGHFLPGLNHLWTLAVEEQFYLVWPFLIFLIPPKKFWMFCLFLIVAAIGIRCWMIVSGWSPESVIVLMPCRMDSFAIGGIAAALVNSQKGLSWSKSLAKYVFALLFITMAFISYREGFLNPGDTPIQQYGFTLIALMFGALILMAYTAGEGTFSKRLFENRVLRLLGKYSYALYIFHYPLFLIVEPLWPTSALIGVTGSPVLAAILHSLSLMLLSLVFAWISWSVLEKPVLKLKEKFQRQRLALE